MKITKNKWLEGWHTQIEDIRRLGLGGREKNQRQNRGIIMARKFKPGDKVQIVKQLGSAEFLKGFHIGIKGIVTNNYFPGGGFNGEYPYEVRRLGKKKDVCDVFQAGELKLVKRGNKMKK
jgi:hypothetical protein